MEIPPAEIPADGDVTVSCKIQNTGDRADDQVARLYFRQETSSVKTNEQNLCGFERVHLLPGETKTATFKLTLGSSSEDARLSGGFEVMPRTE